MKNIISSLVNEFSFLLRDVSKQISVKQKNNNIISKPSSRWENQFVGIICKFPFLHWTIKNICHTAIWTNPSSLSLIGLSLIIHAWRVKRTFHSHNLLWHSNSLSAYVAFWLQIQIAVSRSDAIFVVSPDPDGLFVIVIVIVISFI